jgi:hypothetical protein
VSDDLELARAGRVVVEALAELSVWRDGVGRALVGDEWDDDMASGPADLLPLIEPVGAVADLLAALGKYGDHLPDCELWRPRQVEGPHPGCTCGYVAALLRGGRL